MFKNFVIHFKKFDWILVFSISLLSLIGLLSIWSSSSGRNDFSNFHKQIVFLAFGFFLMMFLSFLDWRLLRENSYLILFFYFLCLIALAGVYFFAPEIRGVKKWYKIGPVSLDPIEFTKLSLIIIFAKYFSKRHIEMYRLTNIMFSGFYLFLPALLIFAQPDLGSIVIMSFIWIGILIVSGIKIRHFLILCFCFILIAVLGWIFLLRDYQKERILSFINTQDKFAASAWTETQTSIAIGSGGISGKGIGNGSQTKYGFLPEPQTDFIFSSISEEMGLIGSSVLFFLFGLSIWRIVKIGLAAKNNFPRLFAAGMAIHLISQLFINIGMNLGILPIIGIPLPFISYGGSNLIINFVGLGILQSIRTKP